MDYSIFQVKANDPDGRLYQNTHWLAERGLAVTVSAYDLVYSGSIKDGPNNLDALWRQFAIDRPVDFSGRSLSVSDVVVVFDGDIELVFYRNLNEWVGISNFFTQEKIRPLRKTNIHVCSNRCNSTFATEVHVSHMWEVDAMGATLGDLEAKQIICGPDRKKTWTCLECGAEAKLVNCICTEIVDPKSNICGMVFLPLVSLYDAYWMPRGQEATEYIPIKNGMLTIGGQPFFRSELMGWG